MTQHRQTITPLAASLLQKLGREAVRDLLSSYLHMHVNRMIKANPKIRELVLYGMLEKHYKRAIGIQKYSNPMTRAASG